MIGVCVETEKIQVLQEFFEFFKTPWELYNEDKMYDVVLTDGVSAKTFHAHLVIVYNDGLTFVDAHYNVLPALSEDCKNIQCSGHILPVYGVLAALKSTHRAVMTIEGTDRVAGIEIRHNGTHIIRIGYNIFSEIREILSSGQPVRNSMYPTIELHYTCLRQFICKAGIPLIEIPPVPAGYNFIACLTHDIDFAFLTDHVFDRTFFGFLYRATIGSLWKFFSGALAFTKMCSNWKAFLQIPGVYLGWHADFFMQIDAYLEIEKNRKSTFYLVPFRNIPGTAMKGKTNTGRAVKYDIEKIAPYIHRITAAGLEVGVHGIDAWRDQEKAIQERKRLDEIVGQQVSGIRMHWLYWDAASPDVLERAGFSYDSTSGYNETVGYKAGTVQVFRPPHARTLFELPLHIQDSALFFPRRMGLAEKDAARMVNCIIQNARVFGGIVTINWHDRSLGPERQWGDFYRKVLDSLSIYRAWFATAREAVAWFRKRRSVVFSIENSNGAMAKITVSGSQKILTPKMLCRIYNARVDTCSGKMHSRPGYVEIEFNDDLYLEFQVHSMGSTDQTLLS